MERLPLKGVMGKGKATQRWSDGRIIGGGLTLRRIQSVQLVFGFGVILVWSSW